MCRVWSEGGARLPGDGTGAGAGPGLVTSFVLKIPPGFQNSNILEPPQGHRWHKQSYLWPTGWALGLRKLALTAWTVFRRPFKRPTWERASVVPDQKGEPRTRGVFD